MSNKHYNRIVNIDRGYQSMVVWALISGHQCMGRYMGQVGRLSYSVFDLQVSSENCRAFKR